MTGSQTQNILFTIVGLLMTFSLILAGTLTTHAFAIKRFFNCMTDVADKYGKLSIDDVNLCYDKEYHSGQYATHHSVGADSSSGGGSGSSSG